MTHVLRLTLAFAGWVLAAIVAVLVAAAASLLVASAVPVPVVFLGAGWVVLAVAFAGIGLRLARRKPGRVRMRAALVSAVIATILVGLAIGVPFGDPHQSADPVPGMAFLDLPTGSHIAYVRLPASGDRHEPPIVFVHGGPGTPDMAHDAAYFGQLAADGHDVILYDEIGAGHSARLADPRDYTLARDEADLEALLGALDVQEPIFIAHSYGGTLVADYLAHHPDGASQVIFLAPGEVRPHRIYSGGGMVDRLSGSRRLALYGQLLPPRALFSWLLAQVNPRAAAAWPGDAELDAHFDTIYEHTAPGLACDPTTPLPRPHHLGFFSNAARRSVPDLRPALAEVRAPTLILKPQCDYLPWTYGTDIAGAIPGSALVYIRGAGHSLYVERADEVMAELRAFIAGEPLPIPPMQTLAPPADLDGPIGIAE